MTTAATGPVFSHPHILLTAAITAVLTIPLAVWRLGRDAWVDGLGLGVAVGVSVWLWRASALRTRQCLFGSYRWSAR
ncbi:hypothetical protein ACWEO2_31625 [Nocardia sp. NPDC004278]